MSDSFELIVTLRRNGQILSESSRPVDMKVADDILIKSETLTRTVRHQALDEMFYDED